MSAVAVNLLAENGFTGARSHGTQRGKVIMQIPTSKGTVWERFEESRLEDAIVEWTRSGVEPKQW